MKINNDWWSQFRVQVGHYQRRFTGNPDCLPDEILLARATHLQRVLASQIPPNAFVPHFFDAEIDMNQVQSKFIDYAIRPKSQPVLKKRVLSRLMSTLTDYIRYAKSGEELIAALTEFVVFSDRSSYFSPNCRGNFLMSVKPLMEPVPYVEAMRSLAQEFHALGESAAPMLSRIHRVLPQVSWLAPRDLEIRALLNAIGHAATQVVESRDSTGQSQMAVLATECRQQLGYVPPGLTYPVDPADTEFGEVSVAKIFEVYDAVANRRAEQCLKSIGGVSAEQVAVWIRKYDDSDELSKNAVWALAIKLYPQIETRYVCG